MAKESKSQPSQALTYPRSVYHKDFDHLNATESTLKTHSRQVKTEADHKKLGTDWQPGGHPAFAGSKPSKVEEVEVMEPAEVVEEAPKKSKWGKP